MTTSDHRSGAPNENIVQNYLNMALLNVFTNSTVIEGSFQLKRSQAVQEWAMAAGGGGTCVPLDKVNADSGNEICRT